MTARTALALTALVAVLTACSGGSTGGGGGNDELLSNANAFFKTQPLCGIIRTGPQASWHENDELVTAGLLTKTATGYAATPMLKKGATSVTPGGSLDVYRVCPAHAAADSVANVTDNGDAGSNVALKTHLAWADWAQKAAIQSALVSDQAQTTKPLHTYTINSVVPSATITMKKGATGWQCTLGPTSGPCQ